MLCHIYIDFERKCFHNEITLKCIFIYLFNITESVVCMLHYGSHNVLGFYAN